MIQHHLRSLFRSRLRTPVCLMACGLLLVLALCDNAQAADFFAIITNLGSAPHDHAQLDVSIDTGGAGVPTAITFMVFRASDGTQLASFVVLTNSQGFASSAFAAPPNDNLFAVSGGLTALVKATTPLNVPTATAVLRQTVQGAKIILGVPPVTVLSSTRVSVAIGDLMLGTHLLIANVSGSPTAVDVFFGTASSPGAGRYKNGALGPNTVFQVDLVPTDANSNVIVSSTPGNVIVQLAVDNGKVDMATVLPTP